MIKKFIVLGLMLSAIVGSGSVLNKNDSINSILGDRFSPTSIRNCVLWLDASDTNTIYRQLPQGDVARWSNKSTSGTNNFYQYVSYPPQPRLQTNALNNKSTVCFNGTQWMYANDLSPVANQSIFILAYISPTNKDSFLLGSQDTSKSMSKIGITSNGFITCGVATTTVTSTTQILPSYRIFELTSSSSDFILRYNNQTIITSSHNNYFDNAAPYHLGSLHYGNWGPYDGKNAFIGNIAEVLIYQNRVLTEEEKLKIYVYLSYKWNIPISIYTKSTILSSSSHNSTNLFNGNYTTAVYQGSRLISNPFKKNYVKDATPDTNFTITFLTGTVPETLVLNASYTGPAVKTNAWYDSGNGSWQPYSSKTIVMQGNYVKFKGDWRTSAGTYNSMFYNSLAATNYTCKFSGSFKNYPTHASAYYQMFRGCSRVSSIEDNPVPNLVGAPGGSMFANMCMGMGNGCSLPSGFMNTSGLTGTPSTRMFENAFRSTGIAGSLPENFLNTSGLTGTPAGLSTFAYVCYGMAGVTGSLPDNFMNTSGLTGTPTSSMFENACYGMAGVTGSLPDNFMNTSGLTGAPSANMFAYVCQYMSGVTSLPNNFMNTSGLTGAPTPYAFASSVSGMSSVTNAYDFQLGSGITFDSTNVASLASMCATMRKWGGNVYWGTNLLVNAIPIPTTDLNTFQNCTNMPNYSTINANWK